MAGKLRAAALAAACAARAAANLMPFTLRYTADPAPFTVAQPDGTQRLYVSTSHDLVDQTQYTMYDYSMISTVDLANWLDHGIVFNALNVSWGPIVNGTVTPGAWAQQIVGPLAGAGCPDASCFYMYWPNVYEHANYTGAGTGVAVSTTGPAGPYVDITPGGRYLVRGDDPTVFRDPDTGDVFLCGNPVGGYAAAPVAPLCGRLAPDMVSWAAPPVNLTGIPHFFEAPWLQKMGAGPSAPWLLSYMCPARAEQPGAVGHYGRDICQAVCTPNATNACPLGDYAFVEGGPVQWNPPFDCSQPLGCAEGGGDNAHHGLVRLAGGRWVYAYHTRLLGASRGLPNAGLQRNVAMDTAYPDPATGGATFLHVTATPEWMRPLAYVDPFAAPVPGALTAGASPGMDTVPLDPADPGSPGVGRAMAFPPGGGGWLRVAGVDWGAPLPGGGGLNLTVRVAAVGGAPQPGSTVGVVLTLDAPTGRPVAVCTVPSPSPAPAPGAAGAAVSWATVTCPIAGGAALGVRDAFLSVSTVNPGAPGVLLAWWQASGGAASGAVPPPVVVPCDAVRSKATGGALAVPLNASLPVAAPAGAPPPAATTSLRLVDLEDGAYAVSVPALPGPPYLCAGPAAGSPVTPSAAAPTQPCARFRLVGTTDGSYALYALGVAPAPLALAVDPVTGAVSASAADPRNATADGARFWLECGRPLRAGEL